MKLKKLLSLALASIFIISQSAIAANKESGASQNKDASSNVIHYTKYPRAVNANDRVTIPDPQLKALINKTLDASRKEDQDITKAEMEKLTSLSNKFDFSVYKVSDLTGLEYAVNLVRLVLEGDKKNISDLKNAEIIQHLVNLEILYIYNFNIDTLNLSKNSKLYYLDISRNNLSTIDVSNNINLTFLSVTYNNLSTIDISKNINLNELYIYGNKISTIDVSNNTKLVDLYIDDNKLSNIDLSQNIDLKRLYIMNNNLLEIDISKNVKLTEFGVENQKIEVNLDDVTLQNDKVVIRNKVKFNGAQIGSITGNGVTYDINSNTVTIDNPFKSKSVSYNFTNNSGFSGTVTANLSATGVTLSSKNSTIKVGDTQQLTATVTPDKALDKSVTWSTSDEKIAKVDQTGLVTAVGEGTATITARTNDGGHIATSTITVSYTNQSSSNNPGINNVTNPQTGVAGLSGILGIAGLGLCSIFASRKRKNK